MKKLLAFTFLTLTATVATADTTWLQYSVFSPGDLMLPWARSDVYGLRLDMPYGNNKGDIVGVDLGFVGVADGGMTGFEATMFNVVDLGPTKGLQLGLIANRTKDIYGLQFGGVNWNEDTAFGLQLGAINFDGEFCGAQVGLVNWLAGNSYGVTLSGFLAMRNEFTGLAVAGFNYGFQRVTGAQVGLLNLAASNSSGVQFGLINCSKNHEGVQIGLLNMNSLGFLPCFPFINFNFSR